MQCLPLKTYTADEERALAAALRTLPPGSPIAGAFVDYKKMRDADRACAGAG